MDNCRDSIRSRGRGWRTTGMLYPFVLPSRGRWSKSLVSLTLAGSLLTAASQAPSVQAQTYGHSLTFYWDHDRLFATIDQRLIGTDFQIRAQVTAIARGSATGAAVLPPPDLVVGEQLTSGALRLRRQGDSLVVSEYVGTVDGQLQYRRRAVLPVLQGSASAQRMVVDAAPIWETLEPAMSPGFTNERTDFTTDFTAALLPDRHAWRAPVRQRRTATVVQRLGHHRVTYAVAIVRLPKAPMRPRLFDARVPYYNDAKYIRRHRLEKQDTAAQISDVVRPIIVRSSGPIPARWEPYFENAVAAWNAAFESIGFRGALKLDDARPSDGGSEIVVTVGNRGSGGGVEEHVTDPRSGEILRSRVSISGSMAVEATAYFTLMGSLDPGARSRWSFPDSVSGRLFQLVLTHEIGHALGLNHNFKIDAYPTDSLRQRDFVRRMGFVPTLMGYSFVNFVAQPEDRIPHQDLVARLGLYDRWALHWGYRPIPGATTPEAELPILQQWLTAQDTAPYLRARSTSSSDSPYTVPYMLGDDVLKSVDYGIRNIARLAEMARADLTGHERVMLSARWQALLGYALLAVGDTVAREPSGQTGGDRRTPSIDSAYQVQALRFVLARLFYGQDPLVTQMRFKPSGEDSTLMLFDSLVPEWRASEAITTSSPRERSLQQYQQTKLADVLGRLRRLAAQDRPGTLAALCQDMASLERRLLARATDSLSPPTQQHVERLRGAVQAVFEKNASPCQR